MSAIGPPGGRDCHNFTTSVTGPISRMRPISPVLRSQLAPLGIDATKPLLGRGRAEQPLLEVEWFRSTIWRRSKLRPLRRSQEWDRPDLRHDDKKARWGRFLG